MAVAEIQRSSEIPFEEKVAVLEEQFPRRVVKLESTDTVTLFLAMTDPSKLKFYSDGFNKFSFTAYIHYIPGADTDPLLLYAPQYVFFDMRSATIDDRRKLQGASNKIQENAKQKGFDGLIPSLSVNREVIFQNGREHIPEAYQFFQGVVRKDAFEIKKRSIPPEKRNHMR